MLIFLDFRAQKFPLSFFNVNPFKHQQALHFRVLNYEKQHKEGTCKVSGKSVVFLAFYADFCLCPKLVIITTLKVFCTTFHRYPIFSTRYSVMCKVYTGYCGTSEIEHGLCACTVDYPLAKARGLSLRTGAQTMLYIPLVLTLVH